jgi:hypothetical protein
MMDGEEIGAALIGVALLVGTGVLMAVVLGWCAP